MKPIDELNMSLQYLEKHIQNSQNQLAEFKSQLCTIQAICVQFSCMKQQFSESLANNYPKMIKQESEDETTLSIWTSFSNIMLSMSQEAEQRVQNIFEEAIEPVIHFEENFKHNNEKILEDFQQLISQLVEERILLKDCKRNYFLNKESRQKKPIFESGATNLWQKQEDILEKKLYESQLVHIYSHIKAKVNSKWQIIYSEVPKIFDSYTLMDESKKNFMNNSIVNFTLVFALFLRGNPRLEQALAKIKELQLNRNRGIQKASINLFAQFCKEQKEDSIFKRNYFEKIPDKVPVKYHDMKLVLQQKQQDSAFMKVAENIKQTLIHKKETPLDDPILLYLELREMIVSKEQREQLICQIKTIKPLMEISLQTVQISVNLRHIYKMFFIRVFQSFENDLQESGRGFQQAEHFKQFMQLVVTTLHLTFVPLGSSKHQSLLTLVSPDCNLLYSLQFWQGFFNILLINRKWMIVFDQICRKYQFENISLNSSMYDADRQRSGQKNFLSKIIQTAKKQLVTDQENSTTEEALKTLNHIIILTAINPEFASQVIIQIAQFNRLSQSHTLHLIETQNHQLMQKPIIGKKINQKPKTLVNILIWVIPFLSSQEKTKLLQLRKEFIKPISKKIAKEVLKREGNTLQIRVQAWLTVLDVPSNLFEEDYNNFIQIKNSNKLDKLIEHLIEVDIKRSFNNHGEDKSLVQQIEQRLHITLRAYSYSDKQVSYCQGMNMLMSFFSYVSLDRDIKVSYLLFKGLITKMLRSVFLHGLKNMRVHFYTLERFVALILPDVASHWRKLKIEIGQFATSWYITMYTYGLQMTSEYENQALLELMDIIICEKWAGFYKVTMSILKFYEIFLLEFDFDQTLNFLNNLTKSAFFQYPIQDIDADNDKTLQYPKLENIKLLVREIDIKSVQVQEVEREYYQIREKIDQMNFNGN